MFKISRLTLMLLAMTWVFAACNDDVSDDLSGEDTSTSSDTTSGKPDPGSSDRDTEKQDNPTDNDTGTGAAETTDDTVDTGTGTAVTTDDSNSGVDTGTENPVSTDDSDTTVADTTSVDTVSDTTVDTADTETQDTETDTLPECYGQKMCDGGVLTLCGETGWMAYRDCAAEGFVCEEFMENAALCVVEETAATSLVLTEVSQMQIAPAGIRVVFSVTKDNGMPASGLTAENFTITNDETGLPFSEGGGAPMVGESASVNFYTIIALDMSDSMFTPEGDNSASRAVAAAKGFVANHVAGVTGTSAHYVAIYAFGSSAQSALVQEFTNDAAVLNTTLDDLLAAGSRGGTNLYGAYMASLDTVRTIDTTDGMARLNMILLSDGLHESGNKEEMRAQALESLALGGVDVFAMGMAGDYDEAELRELASQSFYFYSKDDGATVTQKFDLIGDTMAYMTGGNYVVGVCSPLESASSFTVAATQAELTGQMVVAYDTVVEGWTGDVSQCDEAEIADPCLNQQCGESILIPGFQCGGCAGPTEYCDTGMCIDDCENLFCGDSPFLNLSCGTCGDEETCKLGVCEESDELTLQAECAVDMALEVCNDNYPGSNSNIMGDDHWEGKPYPDLTADGDLGYTDAGSWLAFANIDLDKFKKVTIRYASAEDAAGEVLTGFIVMIDSPDGTEIGQIVTDFTGGWSEYGEATANLTATVNGVHTVYLVAHQENINNGNLDWVMFHK